VNNEELHDLVNFGSSKRIACIDFRKRDVIIGRHCVKNIELRRTIRENPNEASKRGEIKQFSRKSVQRLKILSRNIFDLTSMITVTYPNKFSSNGRVIKRHLFNLKRWLRRHGLNRGLWILEFQKRGAPHFHIIVNGFIDKKKLSEAWYKIVGSGDKKHLRAGTNVGRIRLKRGLANYISAYASKAYQKQVPENYSDVGRFWG